MILFYPPPKKFLHGPEFIVMHLSLFSGCFDKIPDRGNWSWKGFIVAHSSRFRCIMAEKSGWQEPEATVHVLSVGIDRKEGSNEHIYTGIQFAFPLLYSLVCPVEGMMLPTVCRPSHLNQQSQENSPYGCPKSHLQGTCAFCQVDNSTLSVTEYKLSSSWS